MAMHLPPIPAPAHPNTLAEDSRWRCPSCRSARARTSSASLRTTPCHENIDSKVVHQWVKVLKRGCGYQSRGVVQCGLRVGAQGVHVVRSVDIDELDLLPTSSVSAEISLFCAEQLLELYRGGTQTQGNPRRW